jgi:hypothetical protein
MFCNCEKCMFTSSKVIKEFYKTTVFILKMESYIKHMKQNLYNALLLIVKL